MVVDFLGVKGCFDEIDRHEFRKIFTAEHVKIHVACLVVGVNGDGACLDQLDRGQPDFDAIPESGNERVAIGHHVDFFDQRGDEFFDLCDIQDILIASARGQNKMFPIIINTIYINSSVLSHAQPLS